MMSEGSESFGVEPWKVDASKDRSEFLRNFPIKCLINSLSA